MKPKQHSFPVRHLFRKNGFQRLDFFNETATEVQGFEKEESTEGLHSSKSWFCIISSLGEHIVASDERFVDDVQSQDVMYIITNVPEPQRR